MTIIAKYAGTCHKCGRRFEAGTKINWTREGGAEHNECPTAQSAPAATNTDSQTEKAPEGIVKVFTNRYKEGGPAIGKVFRARDGQILVVIHISQRFINQDEVDDQDDFRGDGDPFWEFRAVCRPATAEESAPIIEREQKAAHVAETQQHLQEVTSRVRKGENHDPEAESHLPSGEVLCHRKIDNYGHWTQFVLTADAIWHIACQYDSPICGWKVPLDDSLVAELRTLDAALKE